MRTSHQLFGQNAAHNILVFLIKTHKLTYLSHFKTDLRILLPSLDASSINNVSVFSTKCVLYEAFRNFIEEIFSEIPNTSLFTDFLTLSEYVPLNQTEDILEILPDDPIDVEDPVLTIEEELSTMTSAVDIALHLLTTLDDDRTPECSEEVPIDDSVEDVDEDETEDPGPSLSSTLDLSVVEIPHFLFHEDPIPTTEEDHLIDPITPLKLVVAVTDDVQELDVENLPLLLAPVETLQENVPSPTSSPQSKKRKLDVLAVPCDTCTYTSSTKSHTKRHQDAIHRGIKNHVCFCRKSFSTKQNLKSHVKTHDLQ